MHELKLVRGTQITAYADETPLFGLLSLNAVEQKRYHDVYEYLSAEPCERVPQGESYEITLRFLSLFDDQLPHNRAFVLGVEDDDTSYRYSECRLISQKTEVSGNDHVVTVITAKADSMEKRRAEEDG